MTIRRGGSPRDPRQMRDGSSLRGGASPRGAAPHGEAPHGEAPHGEAPHGEAPHGEAPRVEERGGAASRPPAGEDRGWGAERRLPRLSSLPSLGSLPVIPALAAGLGQLISAGLLVVVAVVSLSLLTGQLPIGGNDGQGGPVKTPTPSNVVVVDPRADVLGTLVYVKSGNLWLQSGATARQLTTGGNDSQPTWSADGTWLYFIRTSRFRGHWPFDGTLHPYDLQVPAVMRMHPDGTGAEVLLSGKVTQGSATWSSFIRQPFPNPTGTKVAVITDAPNPSNSDLVLKILDLTTGGLVNPKVPEIAPLGHQDPAWSPDGASILFVKDARIGTRGSPIIQRYDLATKRVRTLTGPGYIGPAWSPNGRYVAATKTGSFGTDVVILDARNGAELLRVTNDELSFAPIWSPAGDAIAFFRVDHGVVDLELVSLKGSGPTWTLGEALRLTISAGLDAASRPSWFIPPEDLPTPPPSTPGPSQAFPTLHAPSAAPGSPAP